MSDGESKNRIDQGKIARLQIPQRDLEEAKFDEDGNLQLGFGKDGFDSLYAMVTGMWEERPEEWRGDADEY